ncbi:hypothetical protein [Varunaivibrio sulfuroxidans]|uniref:Uncharacterized protein n=1 Tax=Varunaivibrio sulfuroxidans TaxID=1773489 RepID=A0A4R3JBA2_9PROT|nr:hypothetical protein [Varunaivibrio sulfuroxidans]TCS62565.1 hypothetical protein EDD55_105111 [Varunaivibrio sulfuroxidans]WES30766.1 hypothetical protein P3M64_14215 [Varunaivibrio sulfuroxidans]
MTARSPELMQAALIDLLIAAAPFRSGRGLSVPRTRLGCAIARARRALDAAALDGVAADWNGLKRLAAEADAEAQNRPGYRADLEG